MVWQKSLDESIADVKEDFIMAVKKAIVDFVLQDTTFFKALGENDQPHRLELKQIGNSFRPNYDVAKRKMERNLHVINPCLAVLTDLWYTHYR